MIDAHVSAVLTNGGASRSRCPQVPAGACRYSQVPILIDTHVSAVLTNDGASKQAGAVMSAKHCPATVIEF